MSKDVSADTRPEKGSSRFIYGIIYLAAAVFFLKILHTYALKAFFEHDLLWFVPTIFQQTKGLTFFGLIEYLIRPFPLWFEVASLKIYVFSVLSLLGPSAKNFLFASVLIHFFCSALLFSVSRSLGLNERTSFLSSLMYLTLFAHFHVYMWPMAFQHLIAIFFILLGLDSYLRTDRLIDEKKHYVRFFAITLLINIMASFCRISIFILPIIILAHIIFCSKDKETSLRKYSIWLPLFAIYLFYPLITIAFGDVRIGRFFNAFIPYKETGVISAAAVFGKFSVLFLVGLFVLFAIRAVLAMRDRQGFAKAFKHTCIGAAIASMITLIAIGGPKRLLIPYNILAPFVGILASFLAPVKNALLIDSSRPHYFIPLQTSVFNCLLALTILYIFVKKFVLKNKRLLILFVFYAVSILYLYLWNPVASRYFVYISPFFCIVFCCAFEHLSSRIAEGLRPVARLKTLIVALIFAAMCIPNLFAIKLALASSKMANTFATYDYIRMANIIREDIGRKDAGEEAVQDGICINNVMPVVSSHEHVLPSDTHNDNIKFVFKQAFDDSSIDIKVNPSAKENKAAVAYIQDGYSVKDAQGVNVDLFSRLFEEALTNLKQRNYAYAQVLLEEALDKRPHLLNYILGDLELSDIHYIANGRDLRELVDKIGSFNILYSPGINERFIERNTYIFNLINNEIDEYIQCLFYASYLRHLSGDRQGGERYFSRIRFMEDDFNKLKLWLSGASLVKQDIQMADFLDGFKMDSLYVRPDNYSDRFGFERFLFRLIFT